MSGSAISICSPISVPPGSRSHSPGRRIVSRQRVALDCFGDPLALYGTGPDKSGECCDGHLLAIDFEERTQRSPRVAAAETVCSEHRIRGIDIGGDKLGISADI